MSPPSGEGDRSPAGGVVDPPEVYVDHAAGSPVRLEAFEAMAPWLGPLWGNPSGSHRVARRARAAVDAAREEMAALAGCRPGEVVFCSGGTESDNLAIRGVLAMRGGRAVCGATEHPAVLGPVLAGAGLPAVEGRGDPAASRGGIPGGSVVGVAPNGLVDEDSLAAVLDSEVTLVSVGLVNNETGVIQDLARIAERVRRGAPQAALHTDAVQAWTWMDVGEAAAVADLVSIAAHKFGGPQGVGMLVVRDVPLAALLVGGGQERRRRPGTPSVAGVVGMAAAARAAAADRVALRERTESYRRRILAAVGASASGGSGKPAVVHTPGWAGPSAPTVPGIVHLCVGGLESEELLFLLDTEGVCASAGASCASGALEASHVLEAMGVPREWSAGALRVSLGHSTTDADVDTLCSVLPAVISRLGAAA